MAAPMFCEEHAVGIWPKECPTCTWRKLEATRAALLLLVRPEYGHWVTNLREDSVVDDLVYDALGPAKEGE